MTVTVSGGPQAGNKGTWGEVYDTTTGQAMIYVYDGSTYPYYSQLNITFPPGHSIRGGDVPIVADGRTYEIRAYSGAYTNDMPTLGTLLGSKGFGATCN